MACHESHSLCEEEESLAATSESAFYFPSRKPSKQLTQERNFRRKKRKFKAKCLTGKLAQSTQRTLCKVKSVWPSIDEWVTDGSGITSKDLYSLGHWTLQVFCSNSLHQILSSSGVECANRGHNSLDRNPADRCVYVCHYIAWFVMSNERERREREREREREKKGPMKLPNNIFGLRKRSRCTWGPKFDPNWVSTPN